MKIKILEQAIETKKIDYDFDQNIDNFYKQLFGETQNNGRFNAKNIYTNEEIYLDVEQASLLTIDEAIQIEKDDVNRSLANKILRADGSWWLRSPSKHRHDLALVANGMGETNFNFYVRQPLGVRPALYINNYEYLNLKLGDIYEIKGIWFTYALPGILLARNIVGDCVFRTEEHCIQMSDCKDDNWRFEDKPFNEYETSDVKKYVDEWFNRLKD